MTHNRFELKQRILLTSESLHQTFPYSNWAMYHCILLCFLGSTTLVVYNYSFHKYKLIHQAVWFPLKYLFFTEFSDFLILWPLTHIVFPTNILRRKCAHYVMPFLCNNFMPPVEISVLSKNVLALEIKCKFNPSGLLTEMPPRPPNLSHWVTENVT